MVHTQFTTQVAHPGTVQLVPRSYPGCIQFLSRSYPGRTQGVPGSYTQVRCTPLCYSQPADGSGLAHMLANFHRNSGFGFCANHVAPAFRASGLPRATSYFSREIGHVGKGGLSATRPKSRRHLGIAMALANYENEAAITRKIYAPQRFRCYLIFFLSN